MVFEKTVSTVFKELCIDSFSKKCISMDILYLKFIWINV